MMDVVARRGVSEDGEACRHQGRRSDPIHLDLTAEAQLQVASVHCRGHSGMPNDRAMIC